MKEVSAQTARTEIAAVPVVTSQTLFKGGNLVVIEHLNERYSLRMTKLGKLILTK